MENDKMLSAIINFLFPTLLIYAVFILSGFFDSGFFAFINFFVILTVIFVIFFETQKEFSSVLKIKNLPFFLCSFSIAYIAVIMFNLTDGFGL